MDPAKSASRSDAADLDLLGVADGLDANQSSQLADSIYTNYSNSVSEELKSFSEVNQGKVRLC